MELEQILVRERNALSKIRQLLFPLIGYNVITGFNIYKKQQTKKSEYRVRYSHSDLDTTDTHHKELIEKIGRFTDVAIDENASFEKVDRHTSYRLKRGWKSAKYYDIEARQLTKKEAIEAMNRKETIIGTDFQKDLRIDLDDYSSLTQLLNIFVDYCHAYTIDRQNGKFKKNLNPKSRERRIVNQNAISNAWEIPLITISSNREEIHPSFRAIKEICIDENNFYISILIDTQV